ncbi:AraC family transcriptional regulator [Paenibacillus sp. ACRRX]|uniref:helix-turn-helix domain-containing protein n=1 Tax=Paenibacillus sp. ACRRX TaxID=2918206 RepID=UPI001EF5AE5F|nr:AraC family transcriptional regulator [Paenibacillus sp. ACRRX]MCG7406155.1 AraC family transcriptional regulator [Paenibacillus sp. ACRRX]
MNSKCVQRLYMLREAGTMCLQSNQEPINARVGAPTLLVVDDREVALSINGKCFPVGKGSIVFMRPESTYEISYSGQRKKLQLPYVQYDMYLCSRWDGDAVTYELAHTELPINGVLSVGVNKKVMSWFRDLRECWIGTREMDDANELLRLLSNTIFKGAIQAGSARQDITLEQLLAYIHEHFDRDISRTKIAQLTGFNPRYFSVWFRKQMGWTFTEYVSRIRINEVKKLLLTSEHTISHIAHLVGYADGLYLSRKFKQVTGMTPSQFRDMPVPRRIVCLQFAGDLLALGITPVAVDKSYLRNSLLLSPEWEGVIELDLDHPSLNDWAALQADLVIAPTYVDPKLSELLETAGPLITIEADKLDRIEEVRLFGKLLKLEKQAEAWIAGYRQKGSQARRQLAPLIHAGDTVGVYEIRDDEHLYIWNHTTRGAYNLYKLIGLKPPERVRKEVLECHRHLYIHESVLAEYAADHMFVVVPEEEGWLDKMKQSISRHPIWSTLSAYQYQRIYFIRLEDFWHSEGLALERQLQVQQDILSAISLI